MGDAIARLAQKTGQVVELAGAKARVWIPAYPNPKPGAKDKMVDAHWRDVDLDPSGNPKGLSSEELSAFKSGGVVKVPGKGADPAAMKKADEVLKRAAQQAGKPGGGSTKAREDAAKEYRKTHPSPRTKSGYTPQSPSTYEKRAAASTPKNISSYEGVHPYKRKGTPEKKTNKSAMSEEARLYKEQHGDTATGRQMSEEARLYAEQHGDTPPGRQQKQKEQAQTPSGHRPLNDIAAEIYADWGGQKGGVNFAAKPYLSALRDLSDINDQYMSDSASTIINYFLANASQWRGPKAKEVKAELKAILKKNR